MNVRRSVGILLSLYMQLIFMSAYSQGLDGKLMPRKLRELDKQSVHVEIRGLTIEVMRGKSVKKRVLASGEVKFEIIAKPQSVAKLSADNPLLIFNHGLGEYGFITGEIAIKFKAPQNAANFPSSNFLEFARVGNLDVYRVQASSAEQFAVYIRDLSSREDLLWVEPVVRYFPSISSDELRY
jgi:hypothetical protein